MSNQLSHWPPPLRIRLLLFVVSHIEHFLLLRCPKGRIRRLGLAWVDQIHARVRKKLSRAELPETR